MDRLPFDAYDFFGYIASGLFFVAGMDLVFGFPNILSGELSTVQMALLTLGIYVAGQALAAPAKAFLEDIVVAKFLGRPSVNLFVDKPPRLGAVLFPGFYKPLPQVKRDQVTKRVQDSLGHIPRDEGLFLFVRYSDSIRDNEKLQRRLESFRDKYGFTRNLAFTALVVGIGILLKGYLDPSAIDIRLGWTSLLASVFLFYRYLKFFRQYSYEMFNTFGGGL